MREVPITLQIKRASDLSACNDDGLLAIPELASFAEEQIVGQYQPPFQSFNCSLVNLEHTSCETLGKKMILVKEDIKAETVCEFHCIHSAVFTPGACAE